MYYNIKIKSNGSEFSLESNNKEVLQREMDLYFATIFNVSEEFKSKIKKVEITNENVKSIKEIEKTEEIKETKKDENPIQQLNEEKIRELARIRAQEIIEAQKAKILEEQSLKDLQVTPSEQPVEKSQILNLVSTTPINTQNNISQTEQIPTPVVKFQNEPTTTPQNIQNQEKTATPSDLPDEIMELINLAQKKIETIEKVPASDISSLETESQQKIATKEEKEDTSNQYINQSKLNDIFNISTPNNEELPQEENNITPETDETNIAPDISLADLEISLQQDMEIIQEEPKNEVSNYDLGIKTADNSFQDPQISAIEVLEETPREITPEITNQTPSESSRVPLSEIASQMDFKPFLKSFTCEDLSDEFIVCAYFIKNVLKQSDFTMKFINSKLFQATGKIADLSIIDELTTKEYIRTIDTEDGKKYSITMDGEGYFAAKFQG